MVLVEELIHRLGNLPRPLTILVFVEAPAEVAAVQQLDYRTSGTVEAIYLPVADASPEALAPVIGRLDATITLSRALGEQQLYPAVDPLRSTSRLLAAAGENQATAVDDLRSRLASRVDSQETAILRRYLTQPFYVAEAFTNRAGATVPRDRALADLRALLDGAWRGRDPETLTMIGALPGIG